MRTLKSSTEVGVAGLERVVEARLADDNDLDVEGDGLGLERGGGDERQRPRQRVDPDHAWQLLEGGRDPTQLPEQLGIALDLQAFDTRKSKAIVILELLMIAYSDEDFNVDESNYIKKIADFLEINSMDFTEMKWWAKKKSELDKEALKFF